MLCWLFFSACSSAPPPERPNIRPQWVNSPHSKYNERQYVAVVGFGSRRDEAERAALANLAGIFGLSILDEQSINNIYWEAVRSGITAEWSQTTTIDRTITTSAAMSSLVGAEIRDVWHNGVNTYYVSAVMNRARTAQIYTNMIMANQEMIANLTNVATDQNTMERFARYQLAAAAADINMSYANVLNVIGAPPVAGLRTGDEYRLKAANVAAAIPVRVIVEKREDVDRAGRIHGAFSRAISESGLRTVTGQAPYTLEVSLILSEVPFPGQQNVFVRYEIHANFIDARTRIAQMPPYNIDGREGHINLAQAENRAISAAERRINEEYRDLLLQNLFLVLPRR